jgi:lambda family phage portal protein
MTGDVAILDMHGNPMVSKPSKVSAIAGGTSQSGSTPYDASDNYSQRMSDWQPFLWSPDGEKNTFRDRIVSRSRDIVRNDGWANGAIMRTADNAVGSTFRPISKPDYRALEYYTGNKKFDSVWAAEYGRALDSHYRAWADDVNHYCDSTRRHTISQLLSVAFRHKLIDGDALATILWEPKNIGYGRARYATTIQLLDPDRLCNPQNQYDNAKWRGGVIINHLGAAEAYWIRRAHQGDWFNAGDSMYWDRIERETPWGRPVVVHDFDSDRAGQHRGAVGILNPVLQKLKMLYTYDNAELDQAIINSIFGAYIKSPFDPELVKSALGGDDLPAYQSMRSNFHNQKNIALGGSRIPHLFPGEDFVTVKAEHPSTAFGEFQKTFLRAIAQAAGLSEMQLSGNWADATYSSARGALEEAWKTLGRRRMDFASGFAQPIFSCFVEESFDVDDLPLPSGAPDFIECRQAYSAAKWVGPGRGMIDRSKETQGSQISMEAGLSTLESEAAEQGRNWEDILDQRAIEINRFKELGIDIPAWGAEIETAQAVEKIG